MEEKISQEELEQLMDKLGHQFVMMRTAARKSQNQIIEESAGGIKRGSLIAMENGKYNVGIKAYITYAALLGYEIAFIRKQS